MTPNYTKEQAALSSRRKKYVGVGFDFNELAKRGVHEIKSCLKIPEGAICTNVQWDSWNSYLLMTFQHDSFPEVPSDEDGQFGYYSTGGLAIFSSTLEEKTP